MKPNKRNILLLIIVNIIFALIVLAIPFKFWHSQKTTIKETDAREDKLEDELTQSIKNFTELEEMYLEIEKENIELKEQSDIEWEIYQVTAYTSLDDNCNNISAIGLDIEKWSKYFNFAAVDNKLIPYGSVILVKFDTGIEGFLAVDTGGAVKGKHIDLYFVNDLDSAIDFGIQEREVRVIK